MSGWRASDLKDGGKECEFHNRVMVKARMELSLYSGGGRGVSGVGPLFTS